MQEQEELILIELKDKIVKLKVLPFSTEINVEEIVKIDYNNILGEILTFTVLFNRIANLKAEIDNILAIEKADLDRTRADLLLHYRSTKSSEEKKRTESEVEACILLDEKYDAEYRKYLARKKDAQYLDNLYWTAQSKSQLLQRLSDKLRPEEFSHELLEDTLNGVMIKHGKKLIKDAL